MKIPHDQATLLEMIVRRVYDCGRSGVGGIANADFLEGAPWSAAVAVLAPLFMNSARDPDDIRDFFFNYYSKLNSDAYDADLVTRYIEDLRSLAKKYYCY